MFLLGFRRKLTALALCKSIKYAIQWFEIHHCITFATIQNPAVYLSGARVSIFSTLVPRLLSFESKDCTEIIKLECASSYNSLISRQTVGGLLGVGSLIEKKIVVDKINKARFVFIVTARVRRLKPHLSPINMKKSSRPNVGLNVTQVLVMAEDRINNSNFSNIRTITPLLLSNPDKTICAKPHVVIYIQFKCHEVLSLLLSLSLSLADAQQSGDQFSVRSRLFCELKKVLGH